MDTQDKPIFLLGGKDLEMEEIRRVLNKEKATYFDKQLTWETANLSAYKDKLNKHTIYYAIELNIDLQGYDNVKIIDHHGKLDGNDASLLQVLKILNIPPTRDQELIAANDTRYIEGMECMGATPSEIAYIRKRDREAQGIKHTDELAGKNDARSKKITNNIAIVCATTPYFSTITDSLYFYEGWSGKSIVYDDKKIVFYGFRKKQLIELCDRHNIDVSSYYYGGGDTGYFGMKEGELMPKKRDEIITDLTEEKVLYSSHMFMFPFRFDFATKNLKIDKDVTHEYEFYYEDAIDDRINLEILNTKLAEEGWYYEPYKIEGKDRHLLYNEFAYFYDYARDSLYNRDELPEDAISSFYKKQKDEKDLYEDKTFTIDILKNSSHEASTYHLTIKDVSLRIFHTGVAILSIELDNTKYKEFDDILRINDFGRRVYPQFIAQKDNECTTKKSFLPNYIKIGDDDKEDFNHFDYEDVPIGRHIMQVLGENIFTSKKEETKNKFYIQPSLDDRMFVLSWYGNNELIEELCTCYNYKESDKWYKYVFVDGGNDTTVQNEMMKKELLSEATYDRWRRPPYYGTLYGITRYSFVCLGTNDDYNKEVLPLPHMKTMYFQMATLLLANRTSILRFSDEIAALVSPTKQQKKNTSIEVHTQKLEDLYDKYLIYYNRLYFKEITHQDQGIELYDIGIKQMRIGDHVDKLDGKFEKLFNFMRLKAEKANATRLNEQKKLNEEIEEKRAKEEKKRSAEMDNLTKLGAVFLPPSLTVALLSMSIFDYDQSYTSLMVGLGAVALSAGLGYWAFIKESKDEK